MALVDEEVPFSQQIFLSPCYWRGSQYRTENSPRSREKNILYPGKQTLPGKKQGLENVKSGAHGDSEIDLGMYPYECNSRARQTDPAFVTFDQLDYSVIKLWERDRSPGKGKGREGSLPGITIPVWKVRNWCTAHFPDFAREFLLVSNTNASCVKNRR